MNAVQQSADVTPVDHGGTVDTDAAAAVGAATIEEKATDLTALGADHQYTTMALAAAERLGAVSGGLAILEGLDGWEEILQERELG